ncbi:MAG TPA: hypothetical protein VLC91_05475 [Spongiibacteraceae bacterium]|nr:hypothetical protein [Spongiibacteraceae bacterium]
MKISTYFFILLAATVTTAVGIKSASQPVTLSACGFIVWAVSPYVYLAVKAKFVSANAATFAVLLLSLIAGSFGVWFIVDAMFIHPDAQGGLIYIFVPLTQWVILVLASVPLFFLNSVKNG